MNRRVFVLAIVVLIVTVVVFVYRQRQREQGLPRAARHRRCCRCFRRPRSRASRQGQVVRRWCRCGRRWVERQLGGARGGWGSGPGKFGRKRAAESSPEGPMALSVAPDGSVVIIDQINRRIERFRDGHSGVSTTPIGGDTVQDLALGPEGRMVLLDRFVDRGVQVYGPDGKLLNDVPLSGKTELGSLTGVFADEQGIYVEREHGMVQRLADANGNRTSGDRELPGRPSRDGQLVIAAAMLERQSGQLLVRAHRSRQRYAGLGPGDSVADADLALGDARQRQARGGSTWQR
jgi:hypothetical protein